MRTTHTENGLLEEAGLQAVKGRRQGSLSEPHTWSMGGYWVGNRGATSLLPDTRTREVCLLTDPGCSMMQLPHLLVGGQDSVPEVHSLVAPLQSEHQPLLLVVLSE